MNIKNRYLSLNDGAYQLEVRKILFNVFLDFGRDSRCGLSQKHVIPVNTPTATLVDVELYLPEHWFAPEMAELREKLGIPDEREFETKIELGWKMIQRTHANGLRLQNQNWDGTNWEHRSI